MLIKCVCSHCGHSYLSDDEAGDLACPRCNSVADQPRNASDIPNAPRGMDPSFFADLDGEDEFGIDEPMEPGLRRFEAKAPPAMFLTRERLVRGLLFGAAATVGLAAMLGGAMAAVGIDLPGAAALILGLVAGVSCRSGFGGRTARQSAMRAAVVVTLVSVIGFAGLTAGTWAVQRLASVRATQTRKELDDGLHGLMSQAHNAQDAGAAIIVKQRIDETRRLRSLSDAQLEDYLWIQQAQLNFAPLAHAKLRLTTAPIVKLGPGSKPVYLGREATLGIRALEILIAVILATRVVRPR
jgi:hypothetical protein